MSTTDTADAPTFEVETCRSCDARIIWTITGGGKRMPVDAEPARDGSVRITAQPGGMLPRAEVLPVAKRFGKTQLRTSHFASCPDAGTWRTPKAGRR